MNSSQDQTCFLCSIASPSVKGEEGKGGNDNNLRRCGESAGFLFGKKGKEEKKRMEISFQREKNTSGGKGRHTLTHKSMSEEEEEEEEQAHKEWK